MIQVSIWRPTTVWQGMKNPEQSLTELFQVLIMPRIATQGNMSVRITGEPGLAMVRGGKAVSHR